MSASEAMKSVRTLGSRFSGGAASCVAGAISQNIRRGQIEAGAWRKEGGPH